MTKSDAIKAFAKRRKSNPVQTDWERGETVSAGKPKIEAKGGHLTQRTDVELPALSICMLTKAA